MTRVSAPFLIEGRPIRCDGPTLVIAEIGVNHDGSVERALELVRIAARCGADAVKLQIFKADALLHASAPFANYQREQVRAADPGDMLRQYELSESQLMEIIALIRELGMVPLATPFSLDDVATVDRLGLPLVKIASPDLVNKPLLREVARLGKPILCSTGAATMDEVVLTAGWLKNWHSSFALLHCISSYPTPNGDAQLCWIGELRERFDVPIGYSDHTTDFFVGALAVAAGAVIVERHLTYDRNAIGPDHAASSDPEQFAQYVSSIRSAEILRGSPGKHVLAAEQDVRRVSRQSLVIRRSMQRGEIVQAADLMTQRPGTGIPAASLDRVIGRRLQCRVEAGQMLAWEALGGAPGPVPSSLSTAHDAA